MPGQAAGSDAGHGYRSRSGDGTAALGTLASTPTGSMTGLGSTSEATRSRSGLHLEQLSHLLGQDQAASTT